MRDKIITYLKKVVPRNTEINVTVPEKETFGHYSTNVAFQLAEHLGKTPVSVAEDIISHLRQKAPEEFFKKIEVVPPGFINFWIHDKALLSNLNHLLKKTSQWGKSDIGRGKTVRVEYFQPNVAKIPHVGHLRSAVIGDALKRMFITEGYTVVSDTHIGDWGTQFGILIYGYKSLSEQEKDEVKQNPVEKLNQLYIDETRLIEDDPERRKKAKEEFAKLERGDKENREIWQWMVDVSMEKFREIISQLNLLPFEKHRSESAYEDLMPEIVELSLRKKVAKKTDDGAVVVDLLDYGLDEAVLTKSDGASTYLLRDLATLKYWQRELDFWKNLYVVDVRQLHHFKQLFKVSELLGLKGVNESEHIEFGFMSLSEGAMSTRKGSVISLQSVLDDVVARAREVIQEKNPDLENADEVAKEVGIGALKYFDLSHHRKSNIIFNREEALSFEGDTGPYIQYTNARFLSILRKIGKTPNKMSEGETLDDTERLLLVALLRFPEVIESALEKRTPNTLAFYLHNLSQKANEFYHSHPVMQEESTGKKAFRVALARALSITFTSGLSLLGISAPKQM
ncbi:MAG: arginine--tRNA ligase [Patescibacteria group bacterium]|nr:arginine--tRNA ligase [Patescibacteria group bacterium]